MTMPAALPTLSPPGATARPVVHATAPAHWLNDPHGICWAGGEYHLFYQHNPRANAWAPEIVWGHATSDDLVHWRHQPVALTPASDERGCWTGAVLVENDRPTILYTSVVGDSWDIGRVAAAQPDEALRHWVSARGPHSDVVVEGPPAELGAVVFRDPCLVPTDDGWAMVVGVGVTDGTGLIVQWVSPDGRTWRYDGVVASRPADAPGLWTGTMWECPQLFRLDAERHALVVSVWDDGRLHYDAAAVGRYDGHRFTADRWTRLTHDDIAYAMTSFVDRMGRPTVMFWLREEADHDPGSQAWTGALSLPMLVTPAADGALRLTPHPDVDALRRGVPATGSGPWALGDGGLDVVFPAAAGTVTVTVDGAEAVRLDVTATGLTAVRPGRADIAVPVTDPEVRVVVDAGILSIHGGDGCAAVRFPATGSVAVTTALAGATVQRLAPAV